MNLETLDVSYPHENIDLKLSTVQPDFDIKVKPYKLRNKVAVHPEEKLVLD